MSPSRSGLGRGLAALIPTDSATIQQVDVDFISPNPDQPRKHFDPQELDELARSIAEHGVLQPLLVTRLFGGQGPATYALVAGERRWQAARLAGVAKVPVIVREVQDLQRLELALVENLQRADLSPLEEGEAYHRLIQEFGLTQEDVGRRVGRGRVAVANAIRLLGLSSTLRASLAGGEITAGHARALLGADDERDRLRLLDLIRGRGLSVRQTEAMVRALQQPRTEAPSPRVNVEQTDRAALEEQLRVALATDVELRPGRRGGRIVIRYYGDDDLEEILSLLLRGRASRKGSA
jgi:ParB family chromosome partitioning protein